MMGVLDGATAESIMARHGLLVTQPAEVKPGRRLVLTRASDIEPEPVSWLWTDGGAGRIPAGSLGLAAGREGTGKSSFTLWLAGLITRGELPGKFSGVPRNIYIVTTEDSWKHTIIPRLMAAGADLTRITRVEARDDEALDTCTIMLPTDTALLEEAITADGGIGVVLVDPLMSTLASGFDSNMSRDVRQVLEPLIALADRTGATIIGVAHFNKGSGTDAASRITGSGAFKDISRFTFAFASDPEDGSQGVITQYKNSLGRSDLPSLAYHITSAAIETRHGVTEVGKFVLDGESDRTVEDILSASRGDEAEANDARQFFRVALAGGPRNSKEVEAEARELHAWSKSKMARARKDIGVKARQLHKNEWWICMPEHEGDLDDLREKVA